MQRSCPNQVLAAQVLLIISASFYLTNILWHFCLLYCKQTVLCPYQDNLYKIETLKPQPHPCKNSVGAEGEHGAHFAGHAEPAFVADPGCFAGTLGKPCTIG